MLRVIKELRPRWVLGENVANIVNMAFDDMLSDLEAEGYETGAFIIPACAVGAPHRRDRVWIVAYAECTRSQRENGMEKPAVLAECGQNVANATGQRLEDRRRLFRLSARSHATAETHDDWSAQSGLGDLIARLSSWLAGYRWPAPYGCEQYEWEPPRVTEGKVPYRRQKLQALGNAVVPWQVYPILQAIADIERGAIR